MEVKQGLIYGINLGFLNDMMSYLSKNFKMKDLWEYLSIVLSKDIEKVWVLCL